MVAGAPPQLTPTTVAPRKFDPVIVICVAADPNWTAEGLTDVITGRPEIVKVSTSGAATLVQEGVVTITSPVAAFSVTPGGKVKLNELLVIFVKSAGVSVVVKV